MEPHYRVINDGLQLRNAIFDFVKRLGGEAPGFADDIRCSVGQFKPNDSGMWLKVEVTYLLPCDPWDRPE